MVEETGSVDVSSLAKPEVDALGFFFLACLRIALFDLTILQEKKYDVKNTKIQNFPK